MKLIIDKIKKYKAVTLVETLVYIGVFGIVFIVIMQFVIMMSDNNRLTQQRLETSRSKLFLYEHLEKSFLDADDLSSVETVFDNDNGILTITDQSISEDLKYEIVNGSLVFTRGSNNTVDLNSSNIIVSKFYLEDILDVDSTVIGVDVLLGFSYRGSPNISESIHHLYKLR